MKKTPFEKIQDALDMDNREDWEIISWLTAGGMPEKEARQLLDKFKAKHLNIINI